MEKENQIEMKTPITYYGGKQKMLKYILPLIPEHSIYTEAFFWGWRCVLGQASGKGRIYQRPQWRSN
jgi:DNA adenine methylase